MEGTLLSTMTICSERFTVPAVRLCDIFFKNCAAVATEMCSEWCLSVSYRSAENKTMTKPFMSLTTSKHLVTYRCMRCNKHLISESLGCVFFRGGGEVGAVK
jgi:hypothetical protein